MENNKTKEKKITETKDNQKNDNEKPIQGFKTKKVKKK